MINNLIFLLGVTSSGKTALSIDLAKYLISEHKSVIIVSSDSRQIYKELNLGSGKVEGVHGISKYTNMDCFVFEGVEHFLIDKISPEIEYNISSFIEDYISLVSLIGDIDYIIVTGGSGLYSRAINQEYQLDLVPTQSQYEINLPLKDLQNQLKIDDYNNSDWNNPRRLTNALRKKSNSTQSFTKYPSFINKFNFILKTDSTLNDKIKNRIVLRIELGMLEEFDLLLSKYGFDFMNAKGLEYRYGAYYCLGLLTVDEFVEILYLRTKQFVKRQNTWFAREKDPIYISNLEEIIGLINGPF